MDTAGRAIIGAEMIAAGKGLGYLILDAQQMSRSDKVIVGIFVIGLVGLLCDKAFLWIIRNGSGEVWKIAEIRLKQLEKSLKYQKTVIRC